MQQQPSTRVESGDSNETSRRPLAMTTTSVPHVEAFRAKNFCPHLFPTPSDVVGCRGPNNDTTRPWTMKPATSALALACFATSALSFAPLPSHTPKDATILTAKPAGSFFNPVPDETPDETPEDSSDSMDRDIEELLKQRKQPPLASQPSTINGIPTSQAGQGFGKKSASTAKNSKPYVAVGPKLNDVTKPEYDDQGYTLYADEQTGEKSRVFEALVDYPCDFTLKIVGANEGAFVEEMVAVVAESCDVETVEHSVRAIGKWTSVTVQAPVQSAEMLYALYERVDQDPRVRFKF